MQIAYEIQILRWDYNDHFAKPSIGDRDDPIASTNFTDHATAVQYIADFGVERRVYHVVTTYFK